MKIGIATALQPVMTVKSVCKAAHGVSGVETEVAVPPPPEVEVIQPVPAQAAPPNPKAIPRARA
jgi:hypothetical protein